MDDVDVVRCSRPDVDKLAPGFVEFAVKSKPTSHVYQRYKNTLDENCCMKGVPTFDKRFRLVLEEIGESDAATEGHAPDQLACEREVFIGNVLVGRGSDEQRRVLFFRDAHVEANVRLGHDVVRARVELDHVVL